MKKVFVKRNVRVNAIKGEIEYNETHKRYYFLAVAPAYFDEKTETMYASESVVIGEDNKEALENLYQSLKSFFEKYPNKFATVEKIETTYVEDESEDIAD